MLKTIKDTDAAGFALQLASSDANASGDSLQHGSARQFLTAIFGAKPAELFILVWLLATKRSGWFQDPDAAARYVEAHRDENVYVGVAASPADLGPARRCKSAETAAIFGVCADFDHRSEAHKKKNLPPTLEDARSLIPEDLPPSAIVHSGHGLQAWWLFEAPWVFASPEDRAAAEQLAKDFNAMFQARAAERGWEVDSTWDLARVMRIPGTTNKKPECEGRPVELAELNERRYTPEKIREYITRTSVSMPIFGSGDPPAREPNISLHPTGEKMTPAAATPLAVGGFVLSATAEPPFQKFDVLCENEPRFRDSWDRKRPDLKDHSPSAYDLSLATLAAKVGWTDQEVVNLLIAHRRKHGDDLKLRQDYYTRTISKAWAAAADDLKEQAANEAFAQLLAEATGDAGLPEAPIAPAGEVAAAAMPRADAGGENPLAGAACTKERRDRILAVLSAKFKVAIKRILKFTGDEPQYRLETDLGEVPLGNVNGLIGQSRLRSSIAAATGKYLPHFDPDLWPEIARLLLEGCEDIDRGRDATLIGRMTEWLRAYLRHKQPHESLEQADEGREPFTHNGAVYLFADNLRQWLGVQQGDRITRNILTADLRAFGATPESFEVALNGKRTTRSAWKLPAGLWEPEAGSSPSALHM